MGVDYFNTDCCNEILDDCGDYGTRCEKAGHYVCYECFEKYHNESLDDEKHINLDGDYCGYDIIEEFCPVCIKEKANESDSEYSEYLRLKSKFEK